MIGVSIAGVVVAFALGASLTYLQIPKTKWIGLQANDIPVIVDRLGLSTNTPAVTVKIDDLLMDNKLWANLRECVANDADEANAELRGEVSKQLDQYFDRVAKRFDENPRSIPFNPSTTNDLSNLNSQLSFALLFLSLEKNFDRMTQCLKLLGKMRSTDLSKAGLQLALLNTSTQILTKDFVDAVGGSNAVRDLVRPLYLNAVEAEQLTVDLMTLVRFGTDDQLDCADRVLAPSHLKNYYQRRNSNYWNPDSVRTTVLSLSLQNKVSGVSMSQYAWELEQAKLAEREMPKWFLGNLNRPMSQNFEEDLANQYPIIMHTVWSISYSASEWEYGINHELRNVESTDQSSAATNSQLEVEQ